MRRTILFLCGAAAGLAVLSACGQSVNGSAAAVGSAPTSGASSSGGVNTVAALGELVASHTSGTSAHMSISVTGTGNVTGSGVVKFGNPVAMDETTSIPGMGSMEVKIVDNTVYMQLPDSLKSMAGVTTPWVKIDPNGTGPVSQMLNGSLQSAEQNSDPSQMLTRIKSAGTITSTKTEQLDGAQTTHYTIAVDLQKMVDTGNLPALQAKSLQQAIQLGLKTETMQVWVNSANLPVKFATAISIPNPAGTGQTVNEDVVANFTDWGQPVTVTAPPADQVSVLNK